MDSGGGRGVHVRMIFGVSPNSVLNTNHNPLSLFASLRPRSVESMRRTCDELAFSKGVSWWTYISDGEVTAIGVGEYFPLV